MNSWIPVPSGDGQTTEFPTHFPNGSASQADPMEVYFECITTCSLDDGECITSCTETFRESH